MAQGNKGAFTDATDLLHHCLLTCADEPLESFCKACAEECGVIILPATVYDHEAASNGKHFRLGLGRTNFKDAVGMLGEWLATRGGFCSS